MARYNQETVGGLHGTLVFAGGTSIALQHFGWSHSHTNGTGSSSRVPPDSSMAARLAVYDWNDCSFFAARS
jgi:hypothetical protein